jgi:hypothetical protein
VYRNNPNKALRNIIEFIQNNGNTNIMILDIPHTCDLVEYSSVNRAIKVFSHKLKKVADSFKHVTIIECNYNKEYFNKHIMHLNRRGKGLHTKLKFGIYQQQKRCLQLVWDGKLYRNK